MFRLTKVLIVLALVIPTLDAQWERPSLPFKATAVAGNGENFWICGAESGIASSSDGGIHWDVRNHQTTGLRLLSLRFADEKLGYAGGDGGSLLLTIDGGATWRHIPVSFSDSVLDLSFADPQHGIVLTTDSIRYTQDGGQSWQSLRASQFPELKEFKFVLEVAAIGNTAAVLLKSGPAQFYDQRMISTQDAGRTWKVVPFEHMTINNLLVVQGQYWLAGTEVIDRENRGGHAVAVTLHSGDGVTWERGPKPLIDVNNACRPEGCLMWNGAWFDAFVPNGKVHLFPAWNDPSVKNGRIAVSLRPSFRSTHWAATTTGICTLMPDLQCAPATVAKDLPQRGGPAPSLGAFEVKFDKAR